MTKPAKNRRLTGKPTGRSTKSSDTRSLNLTIGQLLTIADGLSVVYTSAPPGLTSYRITVLRKRLNPELSAAVDSRYELYKKYWKEDERGQCQPDQADPKYPQFLEELKELWKPTVSFNIRTADLMPVSFLSYVKEITPLHVEALMPLIQEDDTIEGS